MKTSRFVINTTVLFILLISMLGVRIPAARANERPPSDGTAPQAEQIVTDTWAVILAPGTDADALAAQLGVENLGQVGSLPNTYLFRAPGSEAELNAMADVFASGAGILWFEQQVARQQSTRDITDPKFEDQWHLNNTGQTGETPGVDANVLPVWAQGYTGTGVVIGVVDDGLYHTGTDLAPNYLSALSWDFNGNDSDPASNSNTHGTAVAGVAAADDDGTCGVGAAYNAGLAGLRLVAGPSTDAMEAAALTYEYQNIHIYNNSWGPTDDGATKEAPGALTQAALLEGITNGRGGRGNIYVWAGGNGAEDSDNVNYDGYANSRFTIAVGAVNHLDTKSIYSEPGAALMVVAPSSPGGDPNTPRITTTANDGCRSNFGGTSSAAPLVAGVIALMLEANPNLGWRDVQHILVQTAVKNHPEDIGWFVNGAGHDFNHKYGFGRVDAEAAVNLAKTWVNKGNATSIDSGTRTVNAPIPIDGNGVTVTFNSPLNIQMEHVEVVFDATHTYRGDLKIILTSPSGTQSVLAEMHDDDGNDYTNWKFMSTANWGENSAGTWSLTVSDEFTTADNDGTLNSWRLILHGTPLPVTFTSAAKQDGWILESDEFSSTGGKMNSGASTLNVGDDSANRQYRTMLSFNTATLPDNAQVTKATLKVKRQGVTGGGNPINTFGGFMVDIQKGNLGKASLQLADFKTKTTKTYGAFKPKLQSGWYTINLTKGRAQIDREGNTQIRLRFKLDDNNNFTANFLKLYSGNSTAANRPQLVVEYYVP